GSGSGTVARRRWWRWWRARRSALEVVPRKFRLEDRPEVGGRRERRAQELVHADEHARDDHAETLREAERQSFRGAARPRLGDHVAGHLEKRGRHAGETAEELSTGGLAAGGRSGKEDEETGGEDERSCHGAS